MKTPALLLAALLLGTVATPLALGHQALGRSSTQAARTIEAAERKAVIDEFAALLRARYVDAATGARYAAALERAAARGDFDKLADASAFAARLTDHVRSVSPDKHLRVSLGDMQEARSRHARAAPPARS